MMRRWLVRGAAPAVWRRAALLLSLWLMESALIASFFVPMTAAAGGRHNTACALGAVAGLIALAYIVTGLLPNSPLSLRAQRFAMIGALLLSYLLILRLHLFPGGPLTSTAWMSAALRDWEALFAGLTPSPVALILLLLCWWRGLRLHERPLSLQAVSLSFRVNVLWLTVAGLIWNPELGDGILPLIFLFFFASLMAMGVARVDEIAVLPEGKEQPFGPAWAAFLAGAALLITGLGWFLGRFYSLAGFGRLGRWLAPLGEALGELLYNLFIALGVLLEPILTFIIRWIGHLATLVSERLESFRIPEPFAGQPAPIPEGEPAGGIPWEAVLQWGGVVVIVVLVLAGLAYSLRKWGQRRPAAGEMEAHEALPPGAWREDLLHHLRAGWDNMVERIGALRPARRGFTWYAEVSIRAIYMNMVRAATERGFPRPPARTPYEYLSQLERAFPHAEDADLRRVTDAYVRLRYGEVPTAFTEVEDIRACWRRIRESEEAPASPSA